jgi:hypothetical protein
MWCKKCWQFLECSKTKLKEGKKKQSEEEQSATINKSHTTGLK